ncbi:Uncharacterised protein [Mycobacteroides abscessus subsp. abscessus]|nr:Uncharacterised protein [Mycobacteroides abscessus subsp. abscessus]
MRGEEDRGATLGAQSADVVPEVRPCLWVEAGGRFVEEDQRGVMDQSHGDVEATLLTARHVLGLPVPETVELQSGEQFVPAPSGVGV